ncbi:hypothetical protein Agub_g8715 [Astrephomene gubernaculifera]|uniref:Smr domain-containing protein n=1 Tax=Astrephomene gubernaculifera TaxID=47775 RepID=A0AAD3HNP5_9CHLO|nr:hypothetical protein Agub_g8715 [Astrephomene gubernaculifera]
MPTYMPLQLVSGGGPGSSIPGDSSVTTLTTVNVDAGNTYNPIIYRPPATADPVVSANIAAASEQPPSPGGLDRSEDSSTPHASPYNPLGPVHGSTPPSTPSSTRVYTPPKCNVPQATGTVLASITATAAAAVPFPVIRAPSPTSAQRYNPITPPAGVTSPSWQLGQTNQAVALATTSSTAAVANDSTVITTITTAVFDNSANGNATTAGLTTSKSVPGLQPYNPLHPSNQVDSAALRRSSNDGFSQQQPSAYNPLQQQPPAGIIVPIVHPTLTHTKSAVTLVHPPSRGHNAGTFPGCVSSEVNGGKETARASSSSGMSLAGGPLAVLSAFNSTAQHQPQSQPQPQPQPQPESSVLPAYNPFPPRPSPPTKVPAVTALPPLPAINTIGLASPPPLFPAAPALPAPLPRPSLSPSVASLLPAAAAPGVASAAALSQAPAPLRRAAVQAPEDAPAVPAAEATPQPPTQTAPASVLSHDDATQREHAQALHELVGGEFDVAMCRDVLAQMDGNLERAAEFILDVGNGSSGFMQTNAAAAAVPDWQHNNASSGAGSAWDVPEGARAGVQGEAYGTWETSSTSDPWATSAAAHGGDGAAAAELATCGSGGVAAGAVEAGGIFAPEPAAGFGAFEANAAAISRAGSMLGSPQKRHASQTSIGHADDAWLQAEGDLEDEGSEDPLEELRIYFPTVDDATLQATLEALNGNVKEALQLLSELKEEDIYREIEMKRQAELDLELAKKLAEQHCASPAGAAGVCQDDDGLDLLVDAATRRQQQQQQQLVQGGQRKLRFEDDLGDLTELERQHLLQAEIAANFEQSQSARQEGQRTGRERWSLKLLVRIFGPDVDEELLAEVLATHEGNVEAARAALRAFGLTEQHPPPEPTSAHQADPPSGSGAVSSAWAANDCWAWDEGSSAAAESQSSLISRRTQSATGLMATAAASGSGSGGGATGQLHRRSGTGAGQLAGTGGGPPRHATSFDEHRQSTVAGSSTAVAPTGGSGSGNPLGPIRLLASIGINFQDMNLSDEALQCIRVAFESSPLAQLLRADNAAQGLLDRQRCRAGSLTHEEKQALWANHREVPLALKEMRELLRRGAKAAYTSAGHGSKRLARELKEAGNALDLVIREQHRKASDRIYANINAALQQQWKTDLHALLPHEALEKLDEQLHKLRIMGGNVDWLIITGKGLHSRGDGPKIPAMVDEWLARRGLERVQQPGAVLVRLTPEVFEGLDAQQAGPSSAAMGFASGSGLGVRMGPGFMEQGLDTLGV